MWWPNHETLSSEGARQDGDDLQENQSYYNCSEGEGGITDGSKFTRLTSCIIRIGKAVGMRKDYASLLHEDLKIRNI